MAWQMPKDFRQWMSQMERRVQQQERRPGNSGPRQVVDTGPPTEGTWERGVVVWNRTPVAGDFMGWVCVTGGTPGVWKTWGPISV